MKIFRHYDDVPAALRGAVVAIGNFDGVHRGHRALIAEAKIQAEARRSPLAVLSFEPHPQEFFKQLRKEGGLTPAGPESFRLTPLRAKARLLADLGVDALFALPFDAEMAIRTPQDFVLNVLGTGLGISGMAGTPDLDSKAGFAVRRELFVEHGTGALASGQSLDRAPARVAARPGWDRRLLCDKQSGMLPSMGSFGAISRSVTRNGRSMRVAASAACIGCRVG